MGANRVVTYVAATYLVAAAVIGAAASLEGRQAGSGHVLFLLNGWGPAIVALGFRIQARAGFADVGWRLPIGWPLLLLLVPAAIFSFSAFAVHVVTGAPIVVLENPAREVVSCLLGALLNALFVFGEEFGWRGYLQPRVIQRFGVVRGLLAMSLVWSLWHFPLDLMGLGYPGVNPLLAAFLLRPMAFLGFGALIGWAFHKTSSLWVACLIHGVHNMMGGRFGRFFDFTPEQNTSVLLVLTATYFVGGVALLTGAWRSDRSKRGLATDTAPSPT